MSFKWLPDADRDPHPRLTWLTECCFDLAISTLYRKEEILPPDYHLHPGTLVVSNHQRDSDVPILTTVLCRRKGLEIRFPLPFYATREDIFRPGFLRDLLTDAAWPKPMPTLLGRVPLRWLFRIVRAQPMRRVREFTFGETLDALCAAGLGEENPRTLLRASMLSRIDARLGHVPPTLATLSSAPLGPLRREFWGLRRLYLRALQPLKTPFREVISGHLEQLAELLEDGRIVYLAPEGTISNTGQMRRLRAGAARLYDLVRESPKIRPAALSYDPLGPGRLRVVVKIGEALDNLDPQDGRGFNATLRKTILSLHAVTPSHLFARLLTSGQSAFTDDECIRWLRRCVAALNKGGVTLDPLLARTDPAGLAGERLEWLARRRLLRRAGTRWINCQPAGVRPGWHHPARVVPYLDAALGEISTLVPDIAAELDP